jgi:hypothetical protein
MGPSSKSLRIASNSKKLAVSHQPERIIQAITGAMTNLDRLKELAKVKEIFT